MWSVCACDSTTTSSRLQPPRPQIRRHHLFAHIEVRHHLRRPVRPPARLHRSASSAPPAPPPADCPPAPRRSPSAPAPPHATSPAPARAPSPQSTAAPAPWPTHPRATGAPAQQQPSQPPTASSATGHAGPGTRTSAACRCASVCTAQPTPCSSAAVTAPGSIATQGLISDPANVRDRRRRQQRTITGITTIFAGNANTAARWK